jgi:nigerose phosphorylase
MEGVGVDFRISDDGFDAERIAHFGNKYLTGNGYMGLRGTLAEYRKEQFAAVNLSGIYDQVGEGWREPLNAPNGLYTYVSIDNTAYRLPETAPVSHRQELDFRRGIHRRYTTWRTPRGTLFVSCERFVSMADAHLICMRNTALADFAGDVTISTGIDADVWDIHGPHYATVDLDTKDDMLTALASTGDGKRVAVCAGLGKAFEPESDIIISGKTIVCEMHIHTRPGVEYTFTKFISVYTSQDGPAPLGAACDCARRAAGAGYDTARDAHIARWEVLWDVSEVTIEGDDEAALALNYSIYHLHSIAPRWFASRSIAARGLSGQTYKGAVFWDTEMFMLDFFLHTEPQVARTLLRYRIDTLPGARDKAREYGYEGAFYAWESQDGGYDACTDYNVTDVFTGRPMRTYFREKQVHISAAIVYALMRYVHYTGDTAILAEGGAETIIECARFYLSLLTKRVNGDRYEIRDVIGPDEYHERVDNNAYTNRMARYTLDAAIEVLDLLKENDPDAYGALDEKYGLSELTGSFREAAARLYIPPPDDRGIIEQFGGYFALEDVGVDEVRARLLDTREYWGGAYGVAAQTQVIKQADVVSLLWLFPNEYTAEILRKNWDYYEPRTEHGSSLSACMYALLACRFGAPERAYPLFMKTASADLAGGGKEWAGLVYIGGTHPAAAGGAWMTAVRGFAGLAAENGEIKINPHLPEKWERLRFKIRFRGDIYVVDIRQDGYEIERIN